MIRVLILILLAGLPAWRSLAGEPSLKAISLDKEVVCIRASRVTADFAAQLQSQWTNRSAGLVLDLRFANGDSAESAKTALAAQKKPFIVLANAKTSGAAADLAAQLQAKGRAIVIGDADLPKPLRADIVVGTNLEDETRFQENPFTVPASNHVSAAVNSNFLPFIDHTSEAELVRRRVKDGEDNFEPQPTPRSAPDQPLIRDPALARAVDVLKAVDILKAAQK